uniref:Uncharacterized protein n=1 Tax=Schistocephalus solidus TaxID=70667 RepID=A0A0X3PEW9_SCHSO
MRVFNYQFVFGICHNVALRHKETACPCFRSLNDFYSVTSYITAPVAKQHPPVPVAPTCSHSTDLNKDTHVSRDSLSPKPHLISDPLLKDKGTASRVIRHTSPDHTSPRLFDRRSPTMSTVCSTPW